jgi:tyrosine-protein kinase Etk/Wzc
MELKKLWQIIINRKWIIIQAFMVIVLTALVGSFLMTPVYRSTAKVVVEEKGLRQSLLSSLGLRDLSAILSLGTFGQEDIMGTQMQLIATRPNLEEVIQRLQLKNDDGSLIRPEQLQVKVEQIEDTNLLKINVDSPNPEEAAQIANTLAQVYVEKSLRESQKNSIEMVNYIDQQREKVKGEWLASINELVKFMKEEGIVDLDLEGKILLERVTALRKELESNQRQMEEVKTKIAEIRKQLANTSKYQVSSRLREENPQIRELNKQLIELNIKLASSKTEYTDSHPVVIALQNQIDSIKKQLKNQIAKTFREEAESINPYYQALIQQLGDHQIQMAELTAKEKILPKTINEYMLKLAAIPDKKAKILRLKTEVNIQEKALGLLLEKAYQTEMATLVQSSNINLVEPATVPTMPVKPNLLLNTAIAIFLGLFFGLGLAFLLEYLDDTLKSPDDIKEFEPLPFFGTIPKWKDGEGILINQMDSRSRMPEAYRAIKNSLRFAAVDKQLKVILVTSALAEEGKSVTVANLGISFSRDNKKVLLLDADLRRPYLHKLFGLSNKIGFSNVIRGDIQLGEAIQQTPVEGVYLLPSGQPPPNPDQYIESPRAQELIENLKGRFDLIIIDSPPILATHDAVVLAKYADAAIDVLEAAKVTKKALSLTREYLANTQIPLLGTILNKFGKDHEGYYYNYYRYYSEN